MNDHKVLLEDIEAISRTQARAEDKMAQVSQLLHGVDGYDWVGFYMVDPDRPSRLVLGSSNDSDNPHVEVAFGKGVCGQVAERGVTIVVDDVADELNYLARDPEVKSEIVLPIFRQGRMAGMLNVESLNRARFADSDRLMLEEICLLLTDKI